MYRTQQGFIQKSSLITIVIMIALLAFVVAKLPRGYSNDMSKIGKGSNVVVLVHNKGSVQSLNTMELLNKIRNEYSGKIDFLIADVDTVEGKAFTQQQKVFTTAALALFAPNGKRLEVLTDIKDIKDLRMALDQTFQINR